MSRIVIIGTLHGGPTPPHELRAVLEEISPDLLLVEIIEEDLREGALEKYPEEMISALGWAQGRGIRVHGFDADIDVFRDGVAEGENERVMALQDAAMEGFTWKDMNREEHLKLLDIPEARALTDPGKEHEREEAMLANIERHLGSGGTIAVLTGCGHLAFFEERLRGAEFPFRNP